MKSKHCRPSAAGISASVICLLTCLSAGQVFAADLGGDCCADLEERVAELEATTARKGNRKVSLAITGWVAEQVIHWDDGKESNTYVAGLGTNYASNVQFTGSAAIAPGWSVGYVLHLEAIDNNLYSLDASHPRSADAGSVNTNESYWFVKSDQFGSVSIGKRSSAGDNAAFLSDLSGTTAAAYWVAYDVWNFQILKADGTSTNITWAGGKNSSGGQCHGMGGGPADCVGSPMQTVRYDSPTIAGFQVVTSWSEDDEWGVTGYYTNTWWHDFLVKGVASYQADTDTHFGAPPGGSLEYTQLAGYLEHVPTGIWGNFQWGHMVGTGYKTDDVYYAKAGIKLHPISLGTTRPYGEYLRANNGVYDLDGNFVPGASETYWGVGVVQDIDAASMQMWLRFRDHELDLPGVDTKDMQTVVFGALISY
ncbi:MAG: porin [Proteobacteria bacterium]|nr:porin [Pseudomonadota bacterium]